MFALCAGKCPVCGCGRGCLAGNGDDDFFPATKEEIIRRLDNNEYSYYRKDMINYLLEHYGYEYS